MSMQKDWTKEELENEYINVMTAITVPVNVQIEGQQRILDITETKRILRNAELIAIGQCGCRTRVKNCDGPVDVCIALDNLANDEINRGLATKTSLEQALQALERAHNAGLVHMAYTFKENEKPDYVCSCCSCCCHSLSALVRFSMPEALHHVLTSDYVAVTNSETCTDCGTCVDRCQFKARHLENGTLVFEEGKCFGCGVCVSTCPTKSISLTKRPTRT
jgi:Pyruvate/2-oxoacid:ferredoxin oxidoreductase delta subunit